jgi:hypothetical protein
VGPVGTTGAFTLLVVLGASGRASAGGGVDCVGADCAWADMAKARESARVRSIMRFVAPINRLSQTGGWSNVGREMGEDVVRMSQSRHDVV